VKPKDFLKEIKRIVKYRDTIKILTISDLKLKYASSTLGFFWSILEPLLLIAVYSLVFPLILHAKFYDWVLFFLAGFIPFRFFERGVRSITKSLVERRNILNRVSMPIIIIPISVAISDSISFFFESIVFFSLILLAGIRPTPLLILFPVLFLVEFFLILGIGFYLCISYIKLRDLDYILNVVLQALMFLTPFVYTLEIIPTIYRRAYLLNPLARLVLMYQGIALYTAKTYVEYIPIFLNTMLLLIFSTIVLIIGFLTFVERKSKFEGEL